MTRMIWIHPSHGHYDDLDLEYDDDDDYDDDD